MSVTVHVWFDYICPFSLIARKLLTEAVTGRDVTCVWHPFETNPHCVEEAGEYPPGAWNRLVTPLAARYDVPLAGAPQNPLRRARLAFVGYQYALDCGAGQAYNDRLFTAYYYQWRDISDPVELTRLAADAGLDPGRFRDAVLSPRYTRRHLDALDHARDREAITGVPVISVAGERLDGFHGVPEPALLAKALDGAAG